jgi:hypothetical protein
MILDRVQQNNLENELAALMTAVENDLSAMIQSEYDGLLDAVYAGLVGPQN